MCNKFLVFNAYGVIEIPDACPVMSSYSHLNFYEFLITFEIKPTCLAPTVGTKVYVTLELNLT